MTIQDNLTKFLHDNLPAGSKVTFNPDGSLVVDSYTTAKGKRSLRWAAVEFDCPADLSGPRVTQFHGRYGEHLARQVFFACLFVGQGEDAAVKFVCECVKTVGSALSGAPQWFFDSHRQEIDAARPVEVND